MNREINQLAQPSPAGPNPTQPSPNWPDTHVRVLKNIKIHRFYKNHSVAISKDPTIFFRMLHVDYQPQIFLSH